MKRCPFNELAWKRETPLHTNSNRKRTRKVQKQSNRLLKLLNKKFRPQHDKMILLLQYCKLLKEDNEVLKNGWVT